MPLLGFKKQFAHMVESGEKRQTIRAIRKYPIKTGDKLYLYTGLRTKSCRKLLETTCKSVKEIKIYRNGILDVGGVLLLKNERESLAISDGFKSAEDFIDFFVCNHGLPFYGQLIKW